MILPHGTIVAVVDGKRLELFRNRGREPGIELVPEPAPDLRAANVGSGGRHRNTTANPDRSRLREDNFAAAVANYLNAEAVAGRIDHLVIVADARTLGELRKHLHATLAEKLVGEIDKDLAGHPVRAIRDVLLAV